MSISFVFEFFRNLLSFVCQLFQNLLFFVYKLLQNDFFQRNITPLMVRNIDLFDPKDEIVIRCGLEEMAQTFFKDYEIIWHDPNVNLQENQQYLAQLEKLCKVKTFTEWKVAEDYIKTAKTVCHVITSGTNGELLMKEIFSSANVPNIFIFCREKDNHSIWAKNYEKVLRIETKIEDVISQIQKNLQEWQKQTSSLKFDLPSFAPIFDESDKSQLNHLHYYLKVIPNFISHAQAKNDFLNLSKAVYSDDESLKLIASFEQTYKKYDMEAMLKWYTKQSFLYKAINNCLRIATSDSIQYCRLLLKDVEKAIKDQYQAKSKNFSGLLHRGAYISEKEWSSLKANVNKEIEMHGFLSVSKKKDVAVNFVKSEPSKKVFITIIVPKGPNEEEQGFAEVEEFSEFPEEKEVIFNVRSRFTVLETDDGGSEDFSYRHLVLLYGAQGLRKFITEKNPLQQVSIEDMENIPGSRCQGPPSEMTEKMLFKSLRDPTKPIYSCKGCLDPNLGPFLCVPLKGKMPTTVKGCLLMDPRQTQIPLYGYECSKCGLRNQKGYFVCTDCNEKKMKWCENCFENSLSCIENGHSVLLETCPFSFWCEKMSEKELNHLNFQNNEIKNSDHLYQQAVMYLETHEYEKAIEYLRIYIRQIEKKGQNQYLAASYSNIGFAYNRQGKYKMALENYLKSLEIQNSVHGERHFDVATLYGNIGLVLNSLGEYKKALEYLWESLDINESAYGENHQNTATSYNNLGLVYAERGEYKKALEYHLKSLDIYKLVHGENHNLTATSYGNVGLVLYHQGAYKKALEYHLKFLNISKLLYGENHPSVAGAYSEVGLAYNNMGESQIALEHYLKCLDIRKSIYGENHPDVAFAYNNIAEIYSKQGKIKEALEYFLKSLDIKKLFYGENHPAIATAYHNIGSGYLQQKEDKKALEYLLKSAEIFSSVHGEGHPSLAISYSNIGCLYDNLGDLKKALGYHLKSLAIYKSVHGEKHPYVASFSLQIGLIYQKQGEYNQALEYLLKSLDIFKSIYGENHQHLTATYNHLGLIYTQLGEHEKAREYSSKLLKIYQ